MQAVQQKLIGFGYYVAGGADGHFGAGTAAALRVFQQQNGLNPTGVVTENTARYLGLAGGVPAGGTPAAPRPAPPGGPAARRPVGVGRRAPPRDDRSGPFGSCNSPFSPRGCTSAAARTARSDHPLTVG